MIGVVVECGSWREEMERWEKELDQERKIRGVLESSMKNIALASKVSPSEEK